MPKTRTPALADWEVSYLIVTSSRSPAVPPVTVRASSLRIRDGAVILEDTYGNPLFSAPVSTTVVRRLEPGLNVQEAKEAAKEVKGHDPAGPAAETVATPAQRRRRA